MIEVKPLTRGQVASSAGLDIETIRFYERQGLIEHPSRSESGYRQYSQGDVSRLSFIRRAKELGFSLKEIGDLLALQENPDTDRADMRERVNVKVADIEEKIRDLADIKAALLQLTQACNNSSGTLESCPIMEALNPTEVGHDDHKTTS